MCLGEWDVTDTSSTRPISNSAPESASPDMFGAGCFEPKEWERRYPYLKDLLASFIDPDEHGGRVAGVGRSEPPAIGPLVKLSKSQRTVGGRAKR